MILPVRLYTDKILHEICEPVTDFTGLESLAQDMLMTMEAYKGVGLAANQIGLSRQMCVLNLEDRSKKLILVNPVITWYTKEWEIQKEGCLSAPGVSVPIKRYLGVEVEAQNLMGETVKYRFTEFDARIFFHEYQHLQGILISDSLLKL
jgi:peptide deformylase